MLIGVADIAKLLKSDRELVKTWAYRFRDHLSDSANPPKGLPRRFTLEDASVLAYVMYYWEDDPDIECIKIGLYRGDHLEEPFSDVATHIVPIFREPPPELDETWRWGALVGGMAAGTVDTLELANSYKRAGDLLTKTAIEGDVVCDLIYPILFNYRHATELFLKSIVKPKKLDHDLAYLLEKLRGCLQVEFKINIPEWFENTIQTFCDFDPESITFRYGEDIYSRRTGDGGEFWIDVSQLRERMEWLSQSCTRILNARERAGNTREFAK